MTEPTTTEPTAPTEPPTGPAAGPAPTDYTRALAEGLPGTTELLDALHGLLEDPGLRMLWTDTIRRLTVHRARLRALTDLRHAFTAPELAESPLRSDGRLRTPAAAVDKEVTAQMLLWGHLTEEILTRVLHDLPPANSSALMSVEARPPWLNPNQVADPTCSVPLPREEMPPLIGAAMDQLADVEAARLEYLERYGCDCEDRECPDGTHVPEADQDIARALKGKAARFPGAVVAYGDAVAYALTGELRSNLLRRS